MLALLLRMSQRIGAVRRPADYTRARLRESASGAATTSIASSSSGDASRLPNHKQLELVRVCDSVTAVLTVPHAYTGSQAASRGQGATTPRRARQRSRGAQALRREVARETRSSTRKGVENLNEFDINFGFVLVDHFAAKFDFRGPTREKNLRQNADIR
jgi:hypothetical protein